MRSSSTALIAASVMCLLTAPAHALRANTYVASYGTDSGTCSFGAPCRTFSFALSQVQAGGVVTAIDSAGNSAFTIDKSVTIMAPPGVSPSIQTPAQGNGILIEVGPNDVVVLNGLTLTGDNSGSNGILFSGGQLIVVNCVIRGFSGGTGVWVVAPAPSAAQTSVLISNSIVSNNAVGIAFQGANGGGPIIAAVNHDTISNNGEGVEVFAAAAPAEVSIRDSAIDKSGDRGVSVGATCPIVATVALKRVSVNQTPFDPIAVGNCSHVYLSQVAQTLAPPLPYNTGVVILPGSTDAHVYSDGSNLTSAPPNSFEVWGQQ